MGSVSFDLGTITNANTDNAQTEHITLVYRVFVANSTPASAGAQLNNNAQFQWDIDGDGSNDGPADGNTAAAALNVTVREPQLNIEKLVDDPVPHLGQTINYTVTLTNENTPYGTDAFDVSLTDTLPSGMVLDLNSISVNGAPVVSDTNVTDLSSGNTLSLEFAEVGFNSVITIGYAAVVSADTADFDVSLANTASIDWSSLSENNALDGIDQNERGPADGYSISSSESVTLTAPDYTINKSSSNSGSLNAGDSFSYTIIVSNEGTHEGTGVVVTDSFPVAALGEPISISNGGSFNPATGEITWDVGSLAVNQTVTLSVDAIVANPQDVDIDSNDETSNDAFTNAVTVTDDGLNGDDPNPDNNYASDTDTIEAAPDYSVTKTNDIEMASPTDEFSYQISATNTGTQNGSNIVIVDAFPTDILSVVDADGGVVDADSGTITWNIPLMAVGDIIDLTVVVSVIPSAHLESADQLFINSISITDDGLNGADTNPSNNQDSHSDMLLSGPGDPLPLIYLGDDSPGDASVVSDSGFDRPVQQLEVEKISEPRYISSDSMRMGNMVQATYEDDVLKGGELLDTFGNNPVQLCEVHWVDNPWLGESSDDIDNDELLELFISEEKASELDATIIENPSLLADQFDKEADKLFGDNSVNMVELMQELLLMEEDPSSSEPVEQSDTRSTENNMNSDAA